MRGGGGGVRVVHYYSLSRLSLKASSRSGGGGPTTGKYWAGAKEMQVSTSLVSTLKKTKTFP